jgi:methionine sulfoxide reductase heme-binding subunit
MDDALWAFGRVSGLLSMGLLSLSVLLGILTRSGRPLPGIPRFSITLIHRNVSLLAAIFLVFHVGSLMLDSFARINPVDVVVPFLGAYKPFYQGLGTVALDLMAAVVITSLLRHRIGQRAFKAIHWLTYAMWPIAMVHTLGNGTDGRSSWVVGSTIGVSAALVVAVLWRLSASFLDTAKLRQGGAR